MVQKNYTEKCTAEKYRKMYKKNILEKRRYRKIDKKNGIIDSF